jgi:hypothetical protein
MRMGASSFRTASLLCVLAIYPLTSAKAQTDAAWLSAVNGGWTDPSKWSTSPNYPNDESPSAGDTYRVLIDAVGAPYSVEVDSLAPFLAVDRVEIDSPDATLYLNFNGLYGDTGFTATNGIDINAGRLLMQSARIKDTAITGFDGVVQVQLTSGNTPTYFEGVTLGVDMRVLTYASVTVSDHLVLDQATVFLQGFEGPPFYLPGTATLRGSDSEALDLRGAGQINMLGYAALRGSASLPIYLRPGVSLYVDGTTTRRTTGTIAAGSVFYNQGVVTADGPEADLNITAQSISNTGLIQSINGGSVEIKLTDEVLASELGDLQFNNGGVYGISARINNVGQTLAIGGPGDGTVYISPIDSSNDSSITGGTVTTPNDNPIRVRDIELRNITLAGEMAGSMSVYDGLTLNGGQLSLGGRSRLVFAGDQSVSGNGSIVLDNGNATLDVRIGTGEGPVEFGSGITTHIVNPVDKIQTDQFINSGTILIDNYASLRGALTNRGTVHVRSATAGFIGGGLAAPIVNEGDFLVEDGALLGLGDGFINTGTITLRQGSELRYSGVYTPDAFGTIQNEGAEIELVGTLDLDEQELDLDQVFGVDRGYLTLNNTFRNGTLSADATGLLAFDRTFTFVDITFDTDTTFYGYHTNYLGGDIRIAQGHTLYLGELPAGVSDSAGISIAPAYIETRDTVIHGPGEIVVTGDSNPQDIEIESGQEQALVIGPDLVVRSEGGRFTFNATNRGIIRINGPEDVLRLESRYYNNEGTVEVNAGQLWIGDGFTPSSLGSVQVAEQADVYVIGEFDLLGGTLDPAADFGGTWHLSTGKIKNGRIETPAGPILLDTKTHGSANGIENVTLAGTVRVENSGKLWIHESLVFDNGRIELGGEASYGRASTTGDNPMLLGTGEIVFTGTGDVPSIGYGNQLTLNGDSVTSRITIAPGIAIRTDGNDGSIRLSALSTSNSGLISAAGNLLNILSPNDVYTFENPDGVLQAINGGTLIIHQMAGDIGDLRIENGGTVLFGNPTPDHTQFAGNYRLSQDLTLDSSESLIFYGTTDLGSTLTVAAGARVLFGNTWTNTGTLNLLDGGVLEIDRLPGDAGTLNLAGTVIINGTMTTPGLKTLPLSDTDVVVAQDGTIDNSQSTLTIGANFDSLELRGGAIQGGTVSSVGTQVLTVNHTGQASTLVGLQDVQSDVDLFGGELTVDASHWSGHLSAREGTRLSLQGAGWDNAGGVSATNATISIAGSPTGLGVFDVEQSLLQVRGVFSSSAIQSAVAGVQSEISIANAGVVENTDNVIVLDQDTLVWSLEGGQLTGGDVNAAGSETFAVRGGALEGVSLAAPIELAGAGQLLLDEQVQANAGLIYTNATGAAVVELGVNQALTGFGPIVFTQGSAASNQLRSLQATLQLPSGLTVRAEEGGQGTVGDTTTQLQNMAVLESRGAGSYLSIKGASVVNNGGILRAVDNGTLVLDGFTGGLGQVEVNAGGTLVVNGSYQIDQPLSINQGTLDLEGTWSANAAVQLNQATLAWSTLPVSGKDAFQLAGATVRLKTAAILPDLPVSFSAGPNGLEIGSGGSLDLLGGTLDSAIHPLTLSGGILRNGGIIGPDNSPVFVTGNSRFDNITLDASVTIAPSITLNIDAGLTNQGNIALLGGTLRSSGLFANATGSRLEGHGELRFDGTLENAGSIAFSSGDTEVRGLVTNLAGGRISTTGGYNTVFAGNVVQRPGGEIHTSAGSVTEFSRNFTGEGVFTGQGTVAFRNFVSTGAEPSVIEFEGDVDFAGSFFSRLTIQLEGTAQDEFDQFIIAGDANLGGFFQVALTNGHTLGPGQEYLIMRIAGQSEGEFRSLTEGALVRTFGDQSLYISYRAGDGNDVALYTTSLVPGDTDGDGDVDDADLSTMFSNYTGPVGTTGGKTTVNGDTDGDGDVDDADLGIAFSEYTGPLVAAVPEPASIVLLSLGGLLAVRRLR